MKLGPESGQDNPTVPFSGDNHHLVTPHQSILPCFVMQGPPIYLASDVHLGVASSETERAFLAWLEHCGAEASRVILNGDLFDFWFEYRSVIPRGYTRILGALSSLIDSGLTNKCSQGGNTSSDILGIIILGRPQSTPK